MRVIYKKYLPKEEIPVYDYARNRKLVKYYTRETMAAVVSVACLFEGRAPDPCMPFFYSSGETEMIDLYRGIGDRITSVEKDFRSTWFVENVAVLISPLERFKTMRNTTACLVAIENGLKGDNGVLLASASGLLYSAMFTETEGTVLIGAGKVYADGTVECGFAEGLPAEFATHPLLDSPGDAIEIFQPSKSPAVWPS